MNLSFLTTTGLSLSESHSACIQAVLNETSSPQQAWPKLSRLLYEQHQPFHIHLLFFKALFPDWEKHPTTAPAWIPDHATLSQANLTLFMEKHGFNQLQSFHQWSYQDYSSFWENVIATLTIPFITPPSKIGDFSQGKTSPNWLPDATMNIASACFQASDQKTALIYPDSKGQLLTISYGELNHLSNQIAYSLTQAGFKLGDAVAIAMPMNHFAIAIYLGIIKMGGVVVSIADSFSADEIATRLMISQAKAIFTQDESLWAGKKIPLYPKVKQAIQQLSLFVRAIVLSLEEKSNLSLNPDDMHWSAFLRDTQIFEPIACQPMSPCNILFSSGTTAAPKAIIWNHVTPIKAASDAFFHQNIQPDDILAWPTNLGWMMGPWLIFAALINRATIALYTDAPKDRAFGEYIETVGVTMLGVVPTLVSTWRQTACMEGLNWEKIKLFSSTGECSNPEDMLYLMWLAGYKPIIEYCGGTEIGGAYISSTIIEPNYPSIFTTPTLGLNFILLDETTGQPSEIGEVALLTPAIGLSTRLLNANHDEVYYQNMPAIDNLPPLRRHGDRVQRIEGRYYSVLGRADDAMNLGGIKTSAVEIERVLSGMPGVLETAAIAVAPPQNGPSQLIIFAKTLPELDQATLKKDMQQRINRHLNPLFKIYDLVFVSDLPKTASNKIMRRELRKAYFIK